MTSLPFLKEPEARAIAEQLTPLIVQGFTSQYDFIGAITDATKVAIEPVPTVYYAVRRGTVDYAIFGIFHRYDPKAPHHYDFEGAVISSDTYPMVASVCHLKFNFAQVAESPTLFIEAGGHGIHLKPTEFYKNDWNSIEYSNVNLVSMNWPDKEWERIRKMFGMSVKTPDQWVDIDLENYVKQKKPTINGVRLTTSRGLFWERPDLLFALAAKRKVMA